MSDSDYAAHTLQAALFFAYEDKESVAQIDQKIHDACGLKYDYLQMIQHVTLCLNHEIREYEITKSLDTLTGYEMDTMQSLVGLRDLLLEMERIQKEIVKD